MKKLDTKQFVKRARAIHGDKYDYSLVEYHTIHEKVKIKCNNCNNIFLQSPNNHLQKRGCPFCKNKKIWSIRKDRTSKEQFIKKAKEKHGNKYDYSLVEYKTVDDEIKIICPIHGLFFQSPYNHLRTKYGCPKCSTFINSNKRTLTKEQFIEKSKIVHGDKYDYSLVEYKNSETKVKIFCKKCQKLFEQKANNHLQGYGCPNCRSSRGEEKILNYLTNNKIIFEKQKTYKELYIKSSKAKLRYDFYIPSKNLLIEYNGRQHYEWVKDFNKTYKDLLYSRHRDWLKRKYAIKNNINLLIIPYWEYENIDKILLEWGLVDEII